MHRHFKEKESDKINRELLNEIYPTEGLNNYFYLGIATMLDALDKITDVYETVTKDDIQNIINHYSKENGKISEFFDRLKKDRN